MSMGRQAFSSTRGTMLGMRIIETIGTEDSTLEAEWGDLSLQGSIKPAPLAQQDQAFSAQIAGKPVPLIRLSDEKLMAG